MCIRDSIWTDTDKSRSGLLKFAFSPEVSFAHYVEYALDVPMYFIIRNHDYIDMTAVTFRHFLEFGHNGERATLEDWNDHLTTLFPETRIKRYIEVRSADSQPPDLTRRHGFEVFGDQVHVPSSLKGGRRF